MTDTLSQPIVEAVLAEFEELGSDGLMSEAGLANVTTVLRSLDKDAWREAVRHLLMFSTFLGRTAESEGFAFQLLQFVEAEVARMPAQERGELPSARTQAAIGGAASVRAPTSAAPHGESGVAARTWAPSKK